MSNSGWRKDLDKVLDAFEDVVEEFKKIAGVEAAKDEPRVRWSKGTRLWLSRDYFPFLKKGVEVKIMYDLPMEDSVVRAIIFDRPRIIDVYALTDVRPEQ